VQLTKESAQLVHKHGLTPTKTPGVSHAMIGKPGNIQNWLQIAKGPGAMLASPAVLAGAAGIMAQLAMQQAMAEITDYLAVIDKKVDDVLRAQTDAVVADMIGVEFVVDEAMTIREQVGRVSEITWSKVQATSMTIARTQAYALRQLDGLSERVEQKRSVGDLADAAKEAESRVQEWLAVLARCFQLQDAVAVLELDRVLEASPEELDDHRLALRAARENRLRLISQSTELMLSRIGGAVTTANAKVLLHPTSSGAVVRSGNQITAAVVDLQRRLDIEDGIESLEARRWADAATEVRDRALKTGGDGVEAAKRLGGETFGRARSVTGRLSSGVADRTLRRRGHDGSTTTRDEGACDTGDVGSGPEV
jgi:hypothetical protein